MSARRKPLPLPHLSVNPLFNADGTYKILQVADLHLSVRHEVCRDVDWESEAKPCVGDSDTITLLERWLDEEKPDLVVFSGDQLNGQFTSWDEKSVMPKYLAPVIQRKIAWTSIMGNQ
jgi:metallophosphoesterase superfamily enzyme